MLRDNLDPRFPSRDLKFSVKNSLVRLGNLGDGNNSNLFAGVLTASTDCSSVGLLQASW